MVIQFVILVLLLHLTTTTPGIQEGESFSCPGNSPCKMALASDNPVTLRCGSKATVHWQHINAANPHTLPLTFIQSSGQLMPPEDLNSDMQFLIESLARRSQLIAGDLKLVSPSVDDTGVYICKDSQKTLAFYEIDFQDAGQIHISHANLSKNLELNTIFDLGDEGVIEMFTVWSNWQPCNKCGTPGERKRIGFCYALVSKDAVLIGGSLPCGILKPAFKEVQFNHSMELQIEKCQEECKKNMATEEEEDESQTELLHVYNTFRYDDAELKCPMTSIYSSIYWEHNGHPITWLKQLNGESSYLLDSVTGGGTLFIPALNNKDDGSYNCYVNRKLAEKFQIIFEEGDDEDATLGVQEYSLIGFGAVLLLVLIIGSVAAHVCR